MNFLRNGLLIFCMVLLQTACSSRPPEADEPPPPAGPPKVLTANGQVELEAIIPELADKRVVLIGENHDRYDHHQNQLTLIQRLYDANKRLSIGMEMFQQPAQPQLDAYIAGKLSEQELLEKTEYFKQWGFDFRLYRPILRFARDKQIPIVALNVPNDVVRKVGKSGLRSLSGRDRNWVPQIDYSDQAYRERLYQVFTQHEGVATRDFQNFLEAQLLWDEAMAERAARYLKDRRKRQLVILAGNGHLAYGAGIPRRLQRRQAVSLAVVLQGDYKSRDRQGAEYLLLSVPVNLPPAGQLGVVLDTQAQGRGVKIQDVMPGSAAKQAGILPSDRLLTVNDRAIQSMQDVRLALLDKKPGDTVQVAIQRRDAGVDREQTLAVVLGQ